MSNQLASNIIFLLLLYYLQGVISGLFQSLKLILSELNVTYLNQGLFHAVLLPDTLKLLWAPFTDLFYWKRFGRRKTWLIPTQYIIAFILIFSASHIQEIIFHQNKSKPLSVYPLVWVFSLLTFLVATQDMVVDAWGIGLLPKENLKWASICKNVGTTLGILTGHSFFLILESVEYSNRYLRPLLGIKPKTNGVINLEEFMTFFGIIFGIFATLILLLKTEKNFEDITTSGVFNKSPSKTFRRLWRILKKKPMQQLIGFLLTWKIGFALDSLIDIKILEADFNRETLSLVHVPFQLLQICIVMSIAKCIPSHRPLDFFLKIYPLKLLLTGALMAWVYAANARGMIFLLGYGVLNSFNSFLLSMLIVVKGSFFAHISDKSIGASYITLLHTISSIGCYIWPTLLSYFALDGLKITEHPLSDKETNGPGNVTCKEEINKTCAYKGSAFYYLSIICLACGVAWWLLYRPITKKLSGYAESAWTDETTDNINETCHIIRI